METSPQLSSLLDDARFNKLFANSSEGTMLLNGSYELIYTSQNSGRILGWDAHDQSQIPLARLVDGEDFNLLRKLLDEISQTLGMSKSCVAPFRHHHGHRIWLECSFTNMLEDPDIQSIVCHFKDVSQKKELEQLLEKANGQLLACKPAPDEPVIVSVTDQKGILSKEKLTLEQDHLRLLESVITNTTDAILITEAEPQDEPGPRILFVNEAFTKMTGYSSDEVLGKTPRILQGPKTDRAELKRLGECVRRWQPCEITVINYKKNGEEFWINLIVVPVANDSGWYTHWISVDRDVTESRKLEQEYNLIFDHAPDIICTIGMDGYFKKVNPALSGLLGYSHQELLARPIVKFIYQEDRVKFRKELKNKNRKDDTFYFEIRFIAKSGQIKWLAWTSTLATEDGLIFAVAKDITERKQISSALEESERNYSLLFELSPLPQWVYDIQTLAFLDVNQAAIDNYGYSKEEFLSMTIKDIRPQEDLPLLLEALDRSRLAEQTIRQGAFRHKKKNGDIIQVEIQSNLIQYKGKPAKIILALDMTERHNYIRAIEEQNTNFRQIAFLQSHVVRAPLARIKGITKMLQSWETFADEREKLLEFLSIAASELDDVVMDISSKTSLVAGIKIS